LVSSENSEASGGHCPSNKCQNTGNFSTKSSESGGVISGGVVSDSPGNPVGNSVPGQDPFDCVDRALEELIPLDILGAEVLELHGEGALPHKGVGGWPRVEDADAGYLEAPRPRPVKPNLNVGGCGFISGPEAPPPHCDAGLNGPGTYKKSNKTEGSESKKKTIRKDLYERQKRYRERKKNKAREIEEHLRECLAQVEALRQVNESIHWRNKSLLMMHSYWDDSISKVSLGAPPCNNDAKRKVNGYSEEVKIREEIKSLGLGAVLERIVEPFLELRKEPENYVVQKLASYVISKWDRETREHCQMKIQNRLSMFLRHYYDATRNEDKDKYARKMHILIQTRRRLADFMVVHHPEFVMARVLEGWVEKGFDPNLMGEDSVEIEKSCTSLLVSNLGLSISQIKEVCIAWSQFVSSWSQEVEARNKLVTKLVQGANWSSTYERGMHTGFQASLELRDATNQLKDTNKIKAMMVLTLSNRLHSLLSPVQLARLGTFYPAYTPNWVCVASIIARERALISV